MLGEILRCAARTALASAAMLLAIDGAFCQATKSKNEIYSAAVPFEAADRLDEYNVSGLWFPEVRVPYAGLSGPAIFVFKNVNSGNHWTVAVNAVALLDKDFWNKHQVANADQLEPKALVDKLIGFGTVPISLSQANRAKVINCNGAEHMPHRAETGGGQCLQLGDVVVDLQDIDFDGEKELIFRHAGIGQRSGDAYEVVRIPSYADLPERETREPFREIDWRTVIDLTRKQIIIEGSNGACSDIEATYSRDAFGGMSMTHFWQSVSSNSSGDCYNEDYAVENQMDGFGQRFKLLSRIKLSGSAAPR